jgi:hypothetical protein
VVEKEPAHDVQDVDRDSDFELGPEEVDEVEVEEEEEAAEEEAPASGEKCKRVATARLADVPLAAVPLTKKEKAAAAKKAAKAAGKTIKKDGPPKRAYVRTGLHSQDPHKAAVARAMLGGLNGLAGLSGGASPDFSTPPPTGDRPNSNCPNS